MSARSKRKIILKSLKKYKTIWHPESTLVYKSRKDRVVIGRYVEDQLIPLDEKALKLCEKWNMKPDESLIEDGSEDNGEDEDEDEDNGNEDEGDEGEAVGGDEAEGGDEGEGEAVGGDEAEGGDEDTAPPEIKETELATPKTTFSDVRQVIEEYNIHTKSFSEVLELWSTKFRKSQDDLVAKQSEYDELEAKYIAIKKKFDTMKSLFA